MQQAVMHEIISERQGSPGGKSSLAMCFIGVASFGISRWPSSGLNTALVLASSTSSC